MVRVRPAAATERRTLGSRVAKKHQRKAIGFVSLVGILTLTTAFLLALAPAPLTPGTQTTLYNVQPAATSGMEAVFQTDRPVRTGQWTGILIRQSRTTNGSARTIATPTAGVGDHFVIGNGRGSANGEIEVSARWMAQMPAMSASDATPVDAKWILICLIGDFDKSKPTELQVARLTTLVAELQSRLSIPSNHVWTLPGTRLSQAGSN